MTEQPMSSGEQAKLLIFAILLVPSIPFLVGIIPAILLIFGVTMMYRNKDFAHIETAARNLLVYTVLGFFIAAGFTLYNGYHWIVPEDPPWWLEDDFLYSVVCLGITCVYWMSIRLLFLAPLRRHRDWVAEHGIFSNKPKKHKQLSTTAEESGSPQPTEPISVADELIKWSTLRDQGVVSEIEFNNAKRKLLSASGGLSSQ